MEKKGLHLAGNHVNPYHFTVGAVVEDGELIAIIRKPDDYYTLPRETAYANESLYDAVVRGLQEEVGVVPEIFGYTGALLEHFNYIDGTSIEKTTVYFHCKKLSSCEKSPEIDEQNDKVLWLPKAEAINRLKACGNEEYKIVLRTV